MVMFIVQSQWGGHAGVWREAESETSRPLCFKMPLAVNFSILMNASNPHDAAVYISMLLPISTRPTVAVVGKDNDRP